MPTDSRAKMAAMIQGHRCDELCGQIMALVRKGLNATAIAPGVGLTRQAVGSRIRRHRGLARRPRPVLPGPHVCDARCAQILTLRASGLTYPQMATRLRITMDHIGQIVVGHNRAIRQAGGRSGASVCVTCHRTIGVTLPDTALLPKDECCGWCCRRWDGDLRNVTPVLLKLAAQLGTQDRHVAMQRLHAWQPRERRNAAETRDRQLGRILQSDFEERDEPDES